MPRTIPREKTIVTLTMSIRGTTDMPATNRQRKRTRQATGFTLIEAALATVIVGTGVLSIVAAQQAYHMKDGWAQKTETAQLLCNEIRQRMQTLPLNDPITGASQLGPSSSETTPEQYNDVYDFAGPIGTNGYGTGTTLDQPMNALGEAITDMPGWSQHITVANVQPDDISSTFTYPLGSTPVVRVTVQALYQSPQDKTPHAITELTWVQTD